VDCIHWVPFESLETLRQNLIRQNLQPRPQG
jgi:ferredoxin